MAFGRLERSPGAKPMSDINMTPLIDVMLVLLVIFIVTAPLIAGGLKLELPKVDAARTDGAPAFIALAVDADGRFYVGEQPLKDEQVAARMRDAALRDAQTEVRLRADRRVPYGRVAELIGLVEAAGLTRIGFITEAPAAPPR